MTLTEGTVATELEQHPPLEHEPPRQKQEQQTGDHFGTPTDVLVVVEEFAPIALDPCSNCWSIVRARVSLDGSSPEQDGLLADWHKLARGGLVYVNPPYSRGSMTKWTQKVLEEAAAGTEIVLLTKSDHSTKWWKRLRGAAGAICYWSERIAFLGASHGAAWPSALWYFGRKPHLFAHVFAQAGDVRILG